MNYSALIEWASEPGTEKSQGFIDRWYKKNASDTVLDDLAVSLANSFVAGDIKYEVASKLFNQIMPVVGFDEAPKVFWVFYIAFEDFELSANPDSDAKDRILSELVKL